MSAKEDYVQAKELVNRFFGETDAPIGLVDAVRSAITTATLVEREATLKTLARWAEILDSEEEPWVANWIREIAGDIKLQVEPAARPRQSLEEPLVAEEEENL